MESKKVESKNEAHSVGFFHCFAVIFLAILAFAPWDAVAQHSGSPSAGSGSADSAVRLAQLAGEGSAEGFSGGQEAPSLVRPHGEGGVEGFSGGQEELPSRQANLVEIREIRFSGNTVIGDEVLREAVAYFTDRPLSFEEMQAAAELVTATYSSKGYILARAYLPEQEIQDGVLRIAIREGILGDIETGEKKYFSPWVLKRHFEPLRGKIVEEKSFEKSLYLSRELPGADMSMAYKKGEAPGTVDLVLDSKDNFFDAVDAGLDYNNFGAEVVSENRYGASVRVTEPLWGSTWGVRGVIGDDIDNSAMIAADASIPVGPYGTSVNGSYLTGDYALGQDLADLGLDGETEIYGFNITHPIIRKATLGLDVSLGYDYKYTKTYVLDTERSIDDLDVYWASVSYDSLDRFFGKNLVYLAYTHGEVNPDDDTDPSRYNGDESFDKVALDAARLQKIPYFDYTTLSLRFYGQYADERLPPVEQILLGGYGSVRGHEPSVLLGDYGFNVSTELLIAPPFIREKEIFGRRIAEMFQLAFFYDYGKIYQQDPIPGEQESDDLAGYGAGLRFYHDRIRCKLDFALPVEKRDDPDAESSYIYLWVSLDIL